MKKRHRDEKIIVGAAVTLLMASLASLVYFIRKDIKRANAEIQYHMDIWERVCEKCDCQYWNKENWDE